MNRQSLGNLLIKGILVKAGRAVDFLTGRNWQPTSNLTTSVLIEKIKKLMDSEIREESAGKFVPHWIWLKAQWNMFNFETKEKIEMLKKEILTAIVDYINDNRYHTYAPLCIEIEPDYFTEGLVLQVGYGQAQSERAEIRIKLDIEKAKVIEDTRMPEPTEAKTYKIAVEYNLGENNKKVTEIGMKLNSRVNIGRAESNDLTIKDATVSKIHASLFLNTEKQLMISDLGSSNGTFINGERIPYGKAYPISKSDEVILGSVKMNFRLITDETTPLSVNADLTVQLDVSTSQNESQNASENQNTVQAKPLT